MRAVARTLLPPGVMSHADYPVHLEITSPPHFERIMLLLRIVLAIVLGAIGVTAGWLVWVLYGALPLIAAIAVSSRGADYYTKQLAPRLWRVVAWMLQLSAFMGLLVDRFPMGDQSDVHIELTVSSHPTARSALLRRRSSIPSGLVLMLFGIVSYVLWIVAAFIVLVGSTMPASILAYQRGILRWKARLVAYHASLVDEYPPFSFDTDAGHSASTPLAST